MGAGVLDSAWKLEPVEKFPDRVGGRQAQLAPLIEKVIAQPFRVFRVYRTNDRDILSSRAYSLRSAVKRDFPQFVGKIVIRQSSDDGTGQGGIFMSYLPDKDGAL